MGLGIPLCQLCGWQSYQAIEDVGGDPIWLCKPHKDLADEVGRMLRECGKLGEIAADGGYLQDLAETFAQELAYSTADPHHDQALIRRRRNRLPSLSTSTHDLLLLIYRSKRALEANLSTSTNSSSAEQWRKTEAIH